MSANKIILGAVFLLLVGYLLYAVAYYRGQRSITMLLPYLPAMPPAIGTPKATTAQQPSGISATGIISGNVPVAGGDKSIWESVNS